MRRIFALLLLIMACSAPQAAHALWADPVSQCAPAGGLYCVPSLTQPSLAGDVVGFRLQNTTGSSVAAGPVTIGHTFRPGDVAAGDVIVARIGGTSYYVQMDVQSTFADTTVRHAALSFITPGSLANTAVFDVMFAKCTSSCPSAPTAALTAAALLGTGYDATATFTWHTPAHATETIHANVCLTGAATPTLLNGPVVKSYIVGGGQAGSTCTVNGTLLKVQFEIRAYSGGATSTDIIPDNTWFLVGSKRNDLNYDISMSDGYTASNIPHTLYGRWHHIINSVASLKLNPQYDVPYLIATGVVPHQDLSRGVSEFGVAGNPGNPTGYCRYQCLIDTPDRLFPMTGTGSLTSFFTDGGGGREDIGPEPDWIIVWLLSQDYRAYYWMMGNADVFGGVQFYFTDEATGHPVDIDNPLAGGSYKYPSIFHGWGYPNNPPLYTGNPGPAFANGTPADPGPVWAFGNDHMPDPSFIPWIITARHYYLENLQGQTVSSVTQDSGNDVGDSPTQCCGNQQLWTYEGHINDLGGQLPGVQTRAVAWLTRGLAETAAYTPDSDPLKGTFNRTFAAGLHNFKRAFVDSDEFGQLGQARGWLGGILIGTGTNRYQAWGMGYDYLNWGLDTARRMNISSTTNSDAEALMRYQALYSTAVTNSGSMGFNPYNGFTYWYPTYNPNTGFLYSTTWGGVYQNGMFFQDLDPGCSGMYAENLHGTLTSLLGACHGIAGVEFTDNLTGSYPGGRLTSMLMDGTWFGTSNIATWRTFAWLKAWFVDYLVQVGTNPNNPNNPGAGVAGWPVVPFNLISAVMPNGKSLEDANNVVNTSTGTQTAAPVNATLPAFLACTRSSSCTLNGGTGSNIFEGAPTGTTTINIGTGGDMAFAAWNASGTTTFVDNTGNDITYGGSGAGANVFDFEVASSGQDLIWNFRPGTDTLKVKQNLNGNGITTAAGLVSAATVSGNDVVFNLGSGNTISMHRGYAASNFTASITMVP